MVVNTQELANTALALATGAQQDTLLLTAWWSKAEQRSVGVKGVYERGQCAGTCQHGLGFANVHQADVLLFAALAWSAKQRMWELNAQSLVKTLISACDKGRQPV